MADADNVIMFSEIGSGKESDILRKRAPFDQKETILRLLNQLADFWVQQRAAQLNISSDFCGTQVEYVRAFGSYGMEAERSGHKGDLDILFIAPNYIHRMDFFSSFYALLAEQPEESISGLYKIESAFVPVIKFRSGEVEVDLTLAVLGLSSVPASDDELMKDEVAAQMDFQSIRSFNGWRVRRTILHFVPDKTLFKNTLSVVKSWARQKGVYSCHLGYLGGIAWAIMVARTCSLNPDVTKVVCLTKEFFHFYGFIWTWREALSLQSSLEVPLPFREAQRKWECCVDDGRDSARFMRILTPCYPYQNVAFNVTSTTFRYMIDRFREASYALTQGPFSEKHRYQALMAPVNPTYWYTSFIAITARAKDEEKLRIWKCRTEAKLRRLVRELDNYRFLDAIQIFPRCYRNFMRKCDDRPNCTWLMGIRSRHSCGSHEREFLNILHAFRSDILLGQDPDTFEFAYSALKDPVQVNELIRIAEDQGPTTTELEDMGYGSTGSSPVRTSSSS